MQHQHSIEDQPRETSSPTQGIIVPLDRAGLKIMSQSLQREGSIEVHAIATTDREPCPTCGKVCVKIHDTRGRMKRDIPLRGYHVRLVISKRRFRCFACHRTFTETDGFCGK